MLTTIRCSLLGAALFFGLAVTGCEVHHHDDAPADIVVEVHNEHAYAVDVEAVDSEGLATDLGRVYVGEITDFVIGDYWNGHTLRARCTCDGGITDSTIAFDGEHWDVH